MLSIIQILGVSYLQVGKEINPHCSLQLIEVVWSNGETLQIRVGSSLLEFREESWVLHNRVHRIIPAEKHYFIWKIKTYSILNLIQT